MSQIILYDLPSKGRNSSWSLNPWKTRISLNYKNIPYTTEWVEYPDIKPKFKDLVPPNECPPAYAEYTIPIVRFDDATIIMDSKAVATELEKRHPSPPLHLNSALVSKVEELVPKIVAPIVPIVLPLTPRNLLNKPSADYFQATRKVRFGKHLDDLAAESDFEQSWKQAQPGLQQASDLLQETNGTFFMGDSPSYADFIFVSLLKWFQRIDPSIYERAVSHDPAFMKLFDACQPWMEKDT